MGTINSVQMIHKRTLLTFILLCFFLLVQKTIGQEESSLRIHGSAGLSAMSEKSFGSGFWSSLGFSIPIKNDLFLSFNFGAWKTQVNAHADLLQNGSLSVSPFFVLLQYHLVSNHSIYPYLFIGGGYIFSSFRMEDVDSIPETILSQKVDNSPGGQVGAGIQLNVSKRMSLNADISYFISKTSGTTTIQDPNFGTTTDDFSLNLSGLNLQFGIKYLL